MQGRTAADVVKAAAAAKKKKKPSPSEETQQQQQHKAATDDVKATPQDPVVKGEAAPSSSSGADHTSEQEQGQQVHSGATSDVSNAPADAQTHGSVATDSKQERSGGDGEWQMDATSKKKQRKHEHKTNRKSTPRCSVLVADTAAFIKNAPLHELAERIVTVPEVLQEIRDKETRRRIQALPYEVEVRQPSQTAISAMSKFAKKTGDLRVLSVADLRVLALTYMLEVEEHGSDSHLNTEPKRLNSSALRKNREQKQQSAGERKAPDSKQQQPEQRRESSGEKKEGGKQVEEQVEPEQKGRGEQQKEKQEEVEEEEKQKEEVQQEGRGGDEKDVVQHNDGRDESGNDHDEGDEDDEEQQQQQQEHGVASPEGDDDDDNDDDGEEEEDHGDDDDDWEVVPIKKGGKKMTEAARRRKEAAMRRDAKFFSTSVNPNDDAGWITPGNVKKVVKKMKKQNVDKRAVSKVACMTTDFAMQNVLLQKGLHLMSLDGLLVRRLRYYVLKCEACFALTTNTNRDFCSECGHPTLRRLPASVDGRGQLVVHEPRVKRTNLKGTIYPVPLPKGGRHHNLILTEDEQARRRWHPKKKVVDVFSDDYDAHVSPFGTSNNPGRRAVGHKPVPGYGRRNPNQPKPKGKRRVRRK